MDVTIHIATRSLDLLPYNIDPRMLQEMEKVSVILLLLGVFMFATEPATPTNVIKQPVVIDTDIGSFLDDFFAIAFAIRSSHLDVKLIVTASDDTITRAKITAKFLFLLGRDDIPIAVGLKNNNQTVHTFWDWATDVDLSSYKGGVFMDGIQKMGEVITASPVPVDILAIGPMTNFPGLLSDYPQVVKNSNIRAMMGSVYKGYNNASSPTAEYNVKLCPECADQLLRAGWNVCITPLDTCGYNILSPELEKELLSGTNTASLSLADVFLYDCFTNTGECRGPVRSDPLTLFDAVGTFLLYPDASSYIIFQELKLSVNSTGYTVINNSSGTPVDVALYWQEPNGLYNFQQYMVNVLSNSTYKI